MLYRTMQYHDATREQVNAARAAGETVYRSRDGQEWIPWISTYRCWEDELRFDDGGKPIIEKKA